MIFFSLYDPKDDFHAYLYACYWTYLHVYSKFSLNGRNPYMIQDQFVEVSKTYFREAVTKAGGNIAARIADWDGKKFSWLTRPEEPGYKAKGELWHKGGKKRPILIKLYDAFFQAGDKCIKEFD